MGGIKNNNLPLLYLIALSNSIPASAAGGKAMLRLPELQKLLIWIDKSG